METLEIKVETRKAAEALEKELKARPEVAEVRQRRQKPLDPITAASEASLAESWDSPEDARWDDLLR